MSNLLHNLYCLGWILYHFGDSDIPDFYYQIVIDVKKTTLFKVYNRILKHVQKNHSTFLFELLFTEFYMAVYLS